MVDNVKDYKDLYMFVLQGGWWQPDIIYIELSSPCDSKLKIFSIEGGVCPARFSFTKKNERQNG